MKLSDFIMLSEEEKKVTVLHNGVLVSKRKTSDYFIFLFHFPNFYVETFCNMELKAVTQYQAFTNTELLQPYLESIVIDDVFRADH